MRTTERGTTGPERGQRVGGAQLAELVEEMRPRSATVQDLVLATLREAIVHGVIVPGSRLRQEDLAAIFNTSRIPVREALRALEYEGLVESEPHRGFTVTSLDADQIEEIYDLRIVLESHAVRLALPLLTDVDLQELQDIYDTMTAETDADQQLALRERFYLRLYSITARPRLVGLIARMRQEVARALRWQLVQHSPAHHGDFFEAIKAGDADRATAELASHYRKVAALLRRYLREMKQRGSDGT
ncbi:MAG: GntR family transcriptional regulator [Chloroflexi bacterium]|nr:GntR family transcriptional regulator [Chloroflexota bacterium]